MARKSTLTNSISIKCCLEAIHLDQLFHYPDTNWKERPYEEFFELHEQAINKDRWVIDGNYRKSLPQRLNRATGLILLDVPTPVSLFRYIYRTLFEQHRYGGLVGSNVTLNWKMIHHISVVAHGRKQFYLNLYNDVTLPKIKLLSVKAIKNLEVKWLRLTLCHAAYSYVDISKSPVYKVN